MPLKCSYTSKARLLMSYLVSLYLSFPDHLSRRGSNTVKLEAFTCQCSFCGRQAPSPFRCPVAADVGCWFIRSAAPQRRSQAACTSVAVASGSHLKILQPWLTRAAASPAWCSSWRPIASLARAPGPQGVGIFICLLGMARAQAILAA